MISKRLETVASFVPQESVLLDVGSDHAYLPIPRIQKLLEISTLTAQTLPVYSAMMFIFIVIFILISRYQMRK